jgi:hypothetical protein
MWDKCDLGALDRGIAAFATQAIVALFEEKENELDEKASELGIHIVAELEPDWHNPLGLALICLRDIQAIRQVYPDIPSRWLSCRIVILIYKTHKPSKTTTCWLGS